MKRRLLIIGFCLSLVACAQLTTPSQSPNNKIAYMNLQAAAGSVTNSVTQIGAIEQAAYPPISVDTPPNPSTYGMNINTSIYWNGPVEPLIKKIAAITNYKVKVLGHAPSIPIIVSIRAQNQEAGYILRDAGYQCGKRAQVVVFPATYTIELRYSKS